MEPLFKRYVFTFIYFLAINSSKSIYKLTENVGFFQRNCNFRNLAERMYLIVNKNIKKL